jgi:hypothetical protein
MNAWQMEKVLRYLVVVYLSFRLFNVNNQKTANTNED